LRQRPIDCYIVDFYCPELFLVIEIDGESHNEKMGVDLVRQERLEALQLKVLRFYDWDVRKNLTGVLEGIEQWIEDFETARRQSTSP
jgi:very-short-patch-repair endonuclease